MPQHTTLTEAATAYLRDAKNRSSLALYNAKAQAISSFGAFLQNSHQLSPHKATLDHIELSHVIAYLHELQQQRSVETEHLYTRLLSDFFASVPDIDEPTHASFQTFLTYLQENRRARPHTIKHTPLQAIDEILSAAHTIDVPDTGTPQTRHVLQALRDRAIIYVLAETGLRPTELCTLQQQDFHQESLTITETEALLTSKTAAYLRAYLNTRGQSHMIAIAQPTLFARHDKRAGSKLLPISRWTLANIVTNIANTTLSPATKHDLATNSLSISPISFRHYFVTNTLLTTNNIRTTQTRARHKDIATTRQYVQRSQPPDTTVT